MDPKIKQERLQNRLEPEIKALREKCRTLQLATVDEQGRPNASYAPFVQNQEGYFILISQVARHARNLAVNPQVSIMMIEDEADAKLLFARHRLTFECQAQHIARETPLWQQVITQMKARFGDIVDNLSQLDDFSLICLKPQKGLYVKGFGQAFQVSSDDLIDVVHLQEGHRPVQSVS